MTRTELLCLITIALALTTAGLTWLFGPFGLLLVGLTLGGAALFLLNVKD